MQEYLGPHQIKMKAWISCAPFERLLNIKIEQVTDGQAVLSMPFTLKLAQGLGLMHGGALVSLADTAMVMAIKSLLAPKTYFTTISMESRFLYPVKKGIVTAKARVTARQGQLLDGRVTLYNDEQREVMQFFARFQVAREAQIKAVSFCD
ncbi:MAG: PaaI family thioesterase [Desulfobacteraceae bacterium]